MSGLWLYVSKFIVSAELGSVNWMYTMYPSVSRTQMSYVLPFSAVLACQVIVPPLTSSPTYVVGAVGERVDVSGTDVHLQFRFGCWFGPLWRTWGTLIWYF